MDALEALGNLVEALRHLDVGGQIDRMEDYDVAFIDACDVLDQAADAAQNGEGASDGRD